MSQPLINVEDIVGDRKIGFERMKLLPGSTFRDCSTVIITPTLGKVHYRAAAAAENLIGPMNQRRYKLWAAGHEVGRAYNEMVSFVLGHPVLSTYKYILSLEDDNVPPPDGLIKLQDSIDLGPFDAISGLYFTKGALNMPMAYGDPKSLVTSGQMDFRPRDVVKALASGNIMEVNGIGMGFALWRMDLFREFEAPWFVTVNEVIPEQGVACITQDLYFCERMRRKGKRIAVDLRVPVGHIDRETGEMY